MRALAAAAEKDHGAGQRTLDALQQQVAQMQRVLSEQSLHQLRLEDELAGLSDAARREAEEQVRREAAERARLDAEEQKAEEQKLLAEQIGAELRARSEEIQ